MLIHVPAESTFCEAAIVGASSGSRPLTLLSRAQCKESKPQTSLAKTFVEALHPDARPTDGFVVPRNFQEFFERFPRHVQGFVRRHMIGRPFQDKQERQAELLCYLMTLPSGSRYRCPGTNGYIGGCTDRVMTFNSSRSHGSTRGQFLAYINRLLLNEFINIEKRDQGDATSRRDTIRIEMEESDRPLNPARNEISVDQLHHCVQARKLAVDETAENALVVEFVEFVRRHNRDMLPIFLEFVQCGTPMKAKSALGLPERLFNRARTRLKVLYQCYCAGRTPPLQRRLYRERTPKAVAYGES